MTLYTTAAPMFIAKGIQDKSRKPRIFEAEPRPTHLPKTYFFAKRGPTGEMLCSGPSAVQLYGSESFDLKGPYARHTTALSNILFGAGNAQMMKRLTPADAGPKANVVIWADVLPIQIPRYQRYPDGSIVKDSLGVKQVLADSSPVNGYRIKLVKTSQNYRGQGVEYPRLTANTPDSDIFRNRTIGPGDQFDAASGATSTRYPIFEYWDNFFGSGGNDAGLGIYAPTVKSSDAVNTKLLKRLKAYPYRMRSVRRSDAFSQAQTVKTLTGDDAIEFVIPDGMVNPFTDADVSISKIFHKAWHKTDNPGFVPVYGDVGNFYVYRENLHILLDQLYDRERQYLLAHPETRVWVDLTPTATDEANMINFLSGVYSSGAPYLTFEMNTTDSGALAMSEGNYVLMGGGSDGTMDDATLDSLVSQEVARYADAYDDLMDDAVNVESIIYDSGFGLDTKKDLLKMTSIRKDNAVALSTFISGGNPEKHSDEAAVAASLRSAARMYMESEYFGTPACRVIIIGQDGELVGSTWTERVPLIFDFAEKNAAMMGSGDGKWRKEKLFDSGDSTVVTRVINLNRRFVPPEARHDDWNVGLNYALSYSRGLNHYPALKTVYDDDSSVLTSWFTTMACVELQKIGNNAWRKFTGNTSLSEAQFVEAVEKHVLAELNGKFADMVRVIPKVQITARDKQRGFSWTLALQLGANGMKTVMALSVETYRMDELPVAA